MVKPRMIIVIRHAQSEGNKNREIHQYIPDHRVKLTPEGWQQAEDAGRRLRSMLKPDDTLQFFTSPYKRTRETTEGILKTLTSEDTEQGPSPFTKDKIKVFEEPRLREQDFGNFQPCSAEMERMWQERADYGHFFYRIPNGESAADAYDRCSGFNESLWRQFGDDDFPSVCVLVTHGLMTRIFLMKWYHWSVEHFEDLRNINHCEFLIMEQNPENGKYVLQNQLRTWSDLKKRAAAAQSTSGASTPSMKRTDSVLYAPTRRWGGCANGCDHAKLNYPSKPRRQNTADFMNAGTPLPQAQARHSEKDDHPLAAQEEDKVEEIESNEDAVPPTKAIKTNGDSPTASEPTNSEHGGATEAIAIGDLDGARDAPHGQQPLAKHGQSTIRSDHAHVATRDFVTPRSGVASPASGSDDDSDYFDTNVHQLHARLSISVSGGQGNGHRHARPPRSNLSRSLLAQISDDDDASGVDSGAASPQTTLGRSGSRKSLKERPRAASAGKNRDRAHSHGNGGSSSNSRRRKESVAGKSEQELVEESGMMSGKKADSLGDVDDGDGEISPSSTSAAEGDGKNGRQQGKIADAVVDGLKLKDRKGFDEIY